MAANAPLIGAGITAAGSIYSGIRENQNAGMEAKMLKRKGDDELAIGARKAQAARREGDLALSRAKAVAAASGGGTADDTVTNIMAGIETRRDYNSLTEMYKGQQSRADLYTQANMRRREGRDAIIGGTLNAGSSIYSGIAEQRRANREAEED